LSNYFRTVTTTSKSFLGANRRTIGVLPVPSDACGSKSLHSRSVTLSQKEFFVRPAPEK
jgi:hypothetical protein